MKALQFSGRAMGLWGDAGMEVGVVSAASCP